MNPCNNCCYSGWVTGKVNFYSNAAGVVYQARFTVKVMRERKNQNGEYEYDYIPMRMYGANRMKLAERIKRDDAVTIGGSTRTENEKGQAAMYVNVETIQFSPKSSNKPEQKQAKKLFDFPQFNLPFK